MKLLQHAVQIFTLTFFCFFSEFQAALVDDADSSDPNTPVPSHAPTSVASTSKSKVPLKKGISFYSKDKQTKALFYFIVIDTENLINLIHHR